TTREATGRERSDEHRTRHAQFRMETGDAETLRGGVRGRRWTGDRTRDRPVRGRVARGGRVRGYSGRGRGRWRQHVPWGAAHRGWYRTWSRRLHGYARNRHQLSGPAGL